MTFLRGVSFFCAVAAVLGQTPPSFSPSTSVNLGVTFGSTEITTGEQIDVDVPLDAPELFFFDATTSETCPPATYLVALVDPDAPYPDNPYAAQWLHWLQPSVPVSNSSTIPLDTSAASPIVPYVNPTPPNASPAHRYIVLLFDQPSNFTVPADFTGFNADNRSLFNISLFAEEAGLGAPVAANWFLVSNQTEPEPAFKL